ncbi:helix-turn-helix transcriptional regulator [Pandoraea terrae]|uniref:Helix-turn-helix transcriptional regulator n=1 Tax=Pandoraea terrae TaxID=1537710 RepID=A0A5E4X858_9BURK|nr:helix-turn-helix transcriptional regulator [Pandoraea terrae]VVE32467.1 helix-turn-helix transcriptional regulator [Pandoraea terrae]
MLEAATRQHVSLPVFGLAALSSPQFSALLEKIYQAPLESSPWRGALETIRVMLRARHATLILHPPLGGWPGVMINVSEAGACSLPTASNHSHDHALDPFVGLPADRFTTADKFLGAKAWLDGKLYKQYLRPLDVRYILGADIRTTCGVGCRIRLCRGHDAPDFTVQDEAVSTVLVPHLKRAVDLHLRLGFAGTERSICEGLVNRLPAGMIMLDDAGKILKTNVAADNILSDADGIWRTGGTLAFSCAQAQRRFGELLQRVLLPVAPRGSASDVVEAMSIARPSGNPKLGLLIRGMPRDERQTRAQWRPACAVFLRDPDCRGAPSHDVARKLFNLTASEAALAVRLADGSSVEDAASALGISANTARAYLRVIFIKTGVTRQAGLVSTLLTSVMPLG